MACIVSHTWNFVKKLISPKMKPSTAFYVLQVHSKTNYIIKYLHSPNIHQWINQYIKLYFESFIIYLVVTSVSWYFILLNSLLLWCNIQTIAVIICILIYTFKYPESLEESLGQSKSYDLGIIWTTWYQWYLVNLVRGKKVFCEIFVYF